METVNGNWIMKGMAWNDPYRIRSWQELVHWIQEIGFLPLFANEVEGFSAEEHVSPRYWWTGNREQDPWEWRELIAGSGQVAYGKFFGGKAGFISPEWLPYFANFRRNGYDFDARWEDGYASRREKRIMDFFLYDNGADHISFREERILSTDLKKMAGFGKGGEKNYPGTITGLQMQTYLVIADFQKRKNKKGNEYGMPVSVLLPPEAIWGYDRISSAYGEDPKDSRRRLISHVEKLYPHAFGQDIERLIGKEPVL